MHANTYKRLLFIYCVCISTVLVKLRKVISTQNQNIHNCQNNVGTWVFVKLDIKQLLTPISNININ